MAEINGFVVGRTDDNMLLQVQTEFGVVFVNDDDHRLWRKGKSILRTGDHISVLNARTLPEKMNVCGEARVIFYVSEDSSLWVSNQHFPIGGW